ncbi:MAG: type II toxin-antitoxin system ParD family antitoxin [Woronichinia naegeliana WA131]|jgi:antitoxin ParD1/3/4|uniref:Type II toxin-antitoxin system ParD family antitoxin n=1 Tax=Woronichinia naegeliana WA131 TaxID=2824559 RepID=A0A977KX80_9CYAN|nr:MAG: type II toxin-antitoxin system ParD family antitoxin [Woronichinia naegeliana WA131]
MTQITVELPDELAIQIQSQIAQGEFSNLGEYVVYLLQQEQSQLRSTELEKMFLAGLDSGELIEITDQWWEQKRRETLS